MPGLYLSFAFLIVLICLRLNILVAVPLAVLLLALLNGLDPLALLMDSYIAGLVTFTGDFLFIFMLSSILGTAIKNSGRARDMGRTVTSLFGSRYAATGIFITTALMSYGGINAFVIMFAIFPIAFAVFDQTRLPRSLILSCITGGTILIGLAAPGSPQLHNLILMSFFGTPATAGALPGIVGVSCGTAVAIFYLQHKSRCTQHTERSPLRDSLSRKDLGRALVAFVPLALIVFSLAVLQFSPLVCLALGVLAAFIIDWRSMAVFDTLNEGVNNAVAPLLFAASAMGFARVLAGVEEFGSLIKTVLDLPLHPLLVGGILANLGAGLLGSSSGGLVLIMGTAGEELRSLADPALMHRVFLIASTGLDTLPHNGVYLAMLAYTGLSVRETYFDYTVVTILAPLVGMGAAIAVAVVFC